jgi:hypothetical protein
MKKTGQWLGQMGAALGVIISLCLVAYEMKQARDLAMAELYLERSALLSDLSRALYTPEMLHAALIQAEKREEDLTFTQATVLQEHLFRTAIYFENQHYLYASGLVTEEEWGATRDLLVAEIVRPCSARALLETADTWRASFIYEVKKAIAELGVDPEDCRAPPIDELAVRLSGTT